MISSSQIKEHLALYLDDKIPLAGFEDWFIPNTRDIRLNQSRSALATAIAVEGYLSEYLSGIYNEKELRNELFEIIFADNKVTSYIESVPVPSQIQNQLVRAMSISSVQVVASQL